MKTKKTWSELYKSNILYQYLKNVKKINYQDDLKMNKANQNN